MNDKEALRQHLLKVRRALLDRPSLSRIIQDKFIKTSLFRRAQKVLLYSSTDDEVNTRKLIVSSLDENKRTFLPCVKEVLIGEIGNISDLVDNHFGIAVPPKCSPREDYQELDLIVIPGIGFDRNGNRLGRGWGWYDKFLSDISADVPKAALAFSAQVADSIPTNEFDIRVDIIFTEKEIIDCHIQ